jgi:predicted RNA-binding Zn ribbon-like protein
VSEFRALRRSIRALFEGVTGDGPFPAEAVRHVNEASAAAPTHLHLAAEGTPRAVEIGAAGSRAAELLSLLARSAIGIVGGSDRARLQRCPGCDTFFLASRAGRIWCSQACGNRARVARHRARRRDR